MTSPSKLLDILLANDLDFVVIGGFAGVLHGSSVVTQDIDVCMDLTPTLIGKLRQILKPRHPFHRGHPRKLSFLDHPEDVTNVRNLYLQTDLGPLDILSEVAGIGDFREVRRQSVRIPLFGRDCRVLSLDGLLTSKKALDREKDQRSIKELEAIREKLSVAPASPRRPRPE